MCVKFKNDLIFIKSIYNYNKKCEHWFKIEIKILFISKTMILPKLKKII